MEGTKGKKVHFLSSSLGANTNKGSIIKGCIYLKENQTHNSLLSWGILLYHEWHLVIGIILHSVHLTNVYWTPNTWKE